MLGVERMAAGVLRLGKGRIREIHEPIGVLCMISLMGVIYSAVASGRLSALDLTPMTLLFAISGRA